eukprot:1617368-Prymnesium_polylepis.1
MAALANGVGRCVASRSSPNLATSSSAQARLTTDIRFAWSSTRASAISMGSLAARLGRGLASSAFRHARTGTGSANSSGLPPISCGDVSSATSASGTPSSGGPSTTSAGSWRGARPACSATCIAACKAARGPMRRVRRTAKTPARRFCRKRKVLTRVPPDACTGISYHGGRWPMLSPEAVSGHYARPA